jgi:streptogramin lyase
VVALYPWHNPDKILALLDEFYPLPKPGTPGKLLRDTPYLPYLTFAPSAFVFPLRFTGGGYSGGGKLMIDSEGNAWVADNFTVGAQNLDASWTGGLSKFAPNGRPLSPSPLGFRGGGIAGPGFGLTLDAQDNAWATSFTGQNVTKFDKNGKPLSPPEGWNFNRQISQMQGIIATPSGDIWTLDLIKGQVLKLPQGDPSKVQFFCQNKTGDPLKNPCQLVGPFALAIDQQDRIWVTNAIADHVVRFPASDPSKVETFKVGYSASGLAVDSQGNVWVTNKLGSSVRGAAKFAEMLAAFKFNFDGDPDAGARATKVLIPALAAQTPGYESGGSITVLRPDGSQASFSPVSGNGLTAPWAASVDGNDNIWISNFSSWSAGIVELCGFRTEHCPPGVKTGEAISPRGGYVGGGLQLQVDIGIGPTGDVWVTNNWQHYQDAMGKVDEAVQTQGAGQGIVVFYGMAKPVKTPLVGPPRPY